MKDKPFHKIKVSHDPNLPVRIEIRETAKREDLLGVKLSSEWCKCGKDEVFGCYPEDGECTCGVYKHHVHCGRCGGISQIG